MSMEIQGGLAEFAKSVPGLVMYYTEHADGSNRIKLLNDNALEIWGVTTAEAEADPDKVWGMIHASDLAEMQASVAASARSLSHWEHRWRIFDNTGSKKWLYGRGNPTAMQDGSIRWLTFIFDITSKIEAETEAAKAMDQLAIAMEAIPDGFAIFDENERLVTCNRPFRQIYDKSKGSLVKGASFESILRAGLQVGQYNVPKAEEASWLARRLKNFRHATVVEELQLSDGRWMHVLERPTSNGGRVAFSVDITRAKRRQSELESAALTDALTGLLNRRGLNEKLATHREGRSGGDQIAFLHIDLDKFKSVNDALGHEAGDYILTTVAAKLREIVEPNAIIARMGGDEFVVVLPAAPQEIEVFNTAERLRSAISLPVKYKGRICQVGASIGMSFWQPNANYAIEQALLDADTALMQGKTLGRNRTIIFKERMRSQALETAHLASQIKLGLKNGQFVPYFQPQIEWPSNRLCGFEALVRWIRHDGKATPASAFIEVANETGLIVDIDRQMLARSFDMLKSLRVNGLTSPSLSINLSGAMLRAPDLTSNLLELARPRDITPETVHIEVLEASLLDDRSDAISTNINEMNAAGFRIELDDFGTGHSALASLQKLPVHRIKIDRTLTKSVGTDPSLKAITEGIFGLCKRMNIQTIAEGIETDQQLERLSQMGFSVFQGYRLARPMSLQELENWLHCRGDIAMESATSGPGARHGA